MLIGYVRVSTNDQNTALQRNSLNCAECELILKIKSVAQSSIKIYLTHYTKKILWFFLLIF